MNLIVIAILLLCAGCAGAMVPPVTKYHIVKVSSSDGLEYKIQQCIGSDCILYGYHAPVTPEGLQSITRVYEYFANPDHNEVVEVVK